MCWTDVIRPWSSPPELSGPPAPPGDHGSAGVSSWNSRSVSLDLASVATWSRLCLCGVGLILVMLAEDATCPPFRTAVHLSEGETPQAPTWTGPQQPATPAMQCFTRPGCVGGAGRCGLISEGGQQPLSVPVFRFNCPTNVSTQSSSANHVTSTFRLVDVVQTACWSSNSTRITRT